VGHAGSGDRLLFALDDTPTPRYDPEVQGAGTHRDPTPGRLEVPGPPRPSMLESGLEPAQER
jgi:hypothetical protein